MIDRIVFIRLFFISLKYEFINEQLESWIWYYVYIYFSVTHCVIRSSWIATQSWRWTIGLGDNKGWGKRMEQVVAIRKKKNRWIDHVNALNSNSNRNI